ncbi:hypothetical protein OSB04_011236 [Centaurea solstitialis]|uniref:Uncharacterized protein n=1 Tax=Centaurea solstitialis TaxID=347529 RepID=A0AA38WDI1_9ASTR|nr:hypothetical protein OSB04_011236 [Centaurea solstitialis]
MFGTLIVVPFHPEEARSSVTIELESCLKSIREGWFETLDQCLIRECRISLQAISGHISSDFCEIG